MTILAAIAWLLVIGACVYCVLTVAAARSFLRASRQAAPDLNGPFVSILKPLHGLDEGLEQNLRSFFEQDYQGGFEILFAARGESDEGLALARRLSADYPGIPARFFVTGEPPIPNAKVFSLSLMTREAASDILVMSDSDIRVTPRMLRTIASEFADLNLGVATCPYRAVPGARSFWSTLEAIGMNTEFWGGALAARLVERGVHFAVGPTIAARRSVLEAIGGWDLLSRYLAEDFVMGQFASEKGFGVILSSYVIEHRIGSQSLRANFAHRLRWNRSTRRSRPAGYVGQVFTNPLPLAFILLAVQPASWPVLFPVAALRAWAAHSVSWHVLRDPLCRGKWWLIPLQDLLSFGFWLAGFFGNTIRWRDHRYRLERDGTFRPLGRV